MSDVSEKDLLDAIERLGRQIEDGKRHGATAIIVLPNDVELILRLVKTMAGILKKYGYGLTLKP